MLTGHVLCLGFSHNAEKKNFLYLLYQPPTIYIKDFKIPIELGLNCMTGNIKLSPKTGFDCQTWGMERLFTWVFWRSFIILTFVSLDRNQIWHHTDLNPAQPNTSSLPCFFSAAMLTLPACFQKHTLLGLTVLSILTIGNHCEFEWLFATICGHVIDWLSQDWLRLSSMTLKRIKC